MNSRPVIRGAVLVLLVLFALALVSVSADPATWSGNGFGSCSASCGGGTQTQTLSCVQRSASGSRVVVSDSLCAGGSLMPPQPANFVYEDPIPSAFTSAAWGKPGALVVAGRTNYGDIKMKEVATGGGRVIIYLDVIIDNPYGRYHQLLIGSSAYGPAVPTWKNANGASVKVNEWGNLLDFRVGSVMHKPSSTNSAWSKLEAVLELMVAENPHMGGWMADDVGSRSYFPNINWETFGSANQDAYRAGAIEVVKTFRRVADRHKKIVLVNGSWNSAPSTNIADVRARGGGYPTVTAHGLGIAEGGLWEHHDIDEFGQVYMSAPQWGAQASLGGRAFNFIVANDNNPNSGGQVYKWIQSKAAAYITGQYTYEGGAPWSSSAFHQNSPPAAKPATSRSCNTLSCGDYQWRTGSYGACTQTCGSGRQTRSVVCTNSAGTVVADSNCGSTAKPVTVRACNTATCTTSTSGKWVYGSWSACSTSCGGGTQTRTRKCVSRSTGATISSTNCAWLTPAVTSRNCNTQTCGTSGLDSEEPSPELDPNDPQFDPSIADPNSAAVDPASAEVDVTTTEEDIDSAQLDDAPITQEQQAAEDKANGVEPEPTPTDPPTGPPKEDQPSSSSSSIVHAAWFLPVVIAGGAAVLIGVGITVFLLHRRSQTAAEMKHMQRMPELAAAAVASSNAVEMQQFTSV